MFAAIRETRVCREKTNTFLSRQKTCFVATKVCLSPQNVCRHRYTFFRDKSIFVATSLLCLDKKKKKKKYFAATNICCDKRFVATKKKRKSFCRDKHTFISTKDVFCRGKTRVCRDKMFMFVETKRILMAAPAIDRDQLDTFHFRSLRVGRFSNPETTKFFLKDDALMSMKCVTRFSGKALGW